MKLIKVKEKRCKFCNKKPIISKGAYCIYEYRHICNNNKLFRKDGFYSRESCILEWNNLMGK